MTELFTTIFWNTATQLVKVFLPVILIIITMKIIDKFIIRGAD